MTASPFLRHRNAILATSLTVIALILVTVATINAVERLSIILGPACHRLLPQVPRLPRLTPWRIKGCFDRFTVR